MIPLHSTIGQGMRTHVEKLVNWYGRKEILSASRKQPLQFLLEKGGYTHRNTKSFEQLSTVGKRAWQSTALVSPTKILNQDVAPVGNDIEPVEVLREEVGMGNDEDE